MSATDELRRMLDERGMKWDYGITGATTTRFSVNGIDLTFTPMRDGLVCSTILTPEQAIAATLGDSEYERKMDALLCRLTNGKFSKTRAYDLDFMESVVREEFETDAAALEAGTCEADETETIACRCYGDPHGKAVYHIHVMECTECGHTYEHVNGDYEYCPRCGRKRRDFVE